MRIFAELSPIVFLIGLTLKIHFCESCTTKLMFAYIYITNRQLNFLIFKRFLWKSMENRVFQKLRYVLFLDSGTCARLVIFYFMFAELVR